MQNLNNTGTKNGSIVK